MRTRLLRSAIDHASARAPPRVDVAGRPAHHGGEPPGHDRPHAAQQPHQPRLNAPRVLMEGRPLSREHGSAANAILSWDNAGTRMQPPEAAMDPLCLTPEAAAAKRDCSAPAAITARSASRRLLSRGSDHALRLPACTIRPSVLKHRWGRVRTGLCTQLRSFFPRVARLSPAGCGRPC
jgi:hypothetical protein